MDRPITHDMVIEYLKDNPGFHNLSEIVQGMNREEDEILEICLELTLIDKVDHHIINDKAAWRHV